MNTKSIPVADLQINNENPRTISKTSLKKLMKSIQDFPEMLKLRPIVVNSDMVVLGGNMRLRACIDLGIENVDVVVADLTKEQELEFIAKDNASFGEWNWDMLLNSYDIPTLATYSIEVPKFKIKTKNIEDDNFVFPKDLKYNIVEGDLVQLGPHRLLCGDSTDAACFAALFEDKVADMVLIDPPYNVDYKGGTKDKMKIQNDNMSSSDFLAFLNDAFKNAISNLKKGGSVYVWHSEKEGENFRAALRMNGVEIRQCLIWVKNQIVMGRQDYQWKHEPCLYGTVNEFHESSLYGWKEGASHNWYNDRKQSTILNFKKPVSSSAHPTMKPIPLLAEQIRNSSQVGEIVLDSFSGSGSTIIACSETDRICYAIELEPYLCASTIDRYRKLEPEQPILINGKPLD